MALGTSDERQNLQSPRLSPFFGIHCVLLLAQWFYSWLSQRPSGSFKFVFSFTVTLSS